METLVDGLVFTEGPRWFDGRLWYSDMLLHRVCAVDEGGQVEVVLDLVDRRPSGLGWLPDGRLLVVSMEDRRLLRREHDGQVVEVADLTPWCGGPANDMVVDRFGRAYIGNIGFDLTQGGRPEPTNIVRVDPDGTATCAASDVWCPNGMVITPDGASLIVGESAGRCLTSFVIEPDGSLGDRRTFASFDGGRTPDGICLDETGAVWIASPVTGEFLRVADGGEILDRIQLDDGRAAIACALGGGDGRTLFGLTTPTYRVEENLELRTGRIETQKVEVPGSTWLT